MTEMEKLFNRELAPRKSIIDILGEHEKLIDITVWYDYDPGGIPTRYILALLFLVVVKFALKRRASWK